jgi:quinol monooxygenase YgiN
LSLKNGTKTQTKGTVFLSTQRGKIHGMKSNQIHFRAEFTIEEGKIEEYKQRIQEMSRVVEANEPDIIDYQFYLNRDDETKCVVHETYANSEAALAHNNGVASQTILPKIFTIAKLNRLDVYGKPSEELRKALASFSPSPQFYDLFAGFNR